MDDPLIRYVTTVDGIKIAYWAVGSGPCIVQLPGLPHSHIRIEWETAEWRRGYELAATARTYVRYDTRGCGLSQREVTEFPMEALIADLDAVVSDLPAERVALYGFVNTCPVAIAYAARYPERVSHLMLWCPVVDSSVHRDNPMLEAARRVAAINWEMFSETVAHSLLGWSEPESARRFARLIREGISQRTLLAMIPYLHSLNATDDLPHVRCPTLVLHRPDSRLLPPGTAEHVAATIPNAQLALFEGMASAPHIGDWRAITRAISRFLGVALDAPPRNAGGRAVRLLTMKDDALTPRERQVVDLVVLGLTNREIADRLFLSAKTVGNHIGRILLKLDLRSRTQLAAYAVEHGLTSESA
jgi:DNA-binding CsgD family transcriptional regulator/pimeloyl-ACP methyl ester carboxylesterase